MSILHNDGSSHTHTRSPASKDQRILMLKCPITDLVLCREGLPSFPLSVFLFFEEVTSCAFPEQCQPVDRHMFDGTERDTEGARPQAGGQTELTKLTCHTPTHASQPELLNTVLRYTTKLNVIEWERGLLRLPSLPTTRTTPRTFSWTGNDL